MEIYLAKTQGFCAGVTFAINIVEKALEKYGTPLYVYHDIVHNTYVVNDFVSRGVIFVETLDIVPEGKRLVFSAHGVSPKVINEAKEKNLIIIDATCPLVAKVHKEAVKFSEKGFEVILIGHKGHQEVIGTAGYVNPDQLHVVEKVQDIDTLDLSKESNIAYITQTTLSIYDTKEIIEHLKLKFPNIFSSSHSDICYATQTRQDAIKELAQICDVIIICGSSNSSNSRRLLETGQRLGIESYLVDDPTGFDYKILNGKQNIGISSGASVPKIIVDKLISEIIGKYPDTVVHEFINPEHNIVFPVPNI